MHKPLEMPERMVEFLKAPAALGLEVTTATDVGIRPILVVLGAPLIFISSGDNDL
jgi:hypothetical protein